MERTLREPPHCHNCQNLKRKRTHYYCLALWLDHLHPEPAGHPLQTNAVFGHYKITCSKYHPQSHLDVPFLAQIRRRPLPQNFK